MKTPSAPLGLIQPLQGTPLPVKILDDKKPVAVEILIEVSDSEYFGRAGIDDQLLWRPRHGSTSAVYINELYSNSKRKWRLGSFDELPKSWDGTVYLTRDSFTHEIKDILTAPDTDGVLNWYDDLSKRVASVWKTLVPLEKPPPAPLATSPATPPTVASATIPADDDDLKFNAIGNAFKKLHRKFVDTKKPEKMFGATLGVGTAASQGAAKNRHADWLKWLKDRGFKNRRWLKARDLADAEDTYLKAVESLKPLHLLRSGRGAVCSSFEGKWTSIVVRGAVPGSAEVDPGDTAGWESSDWLAKPDRGGKYPLAFHDYVSALDEVIFHGDKATGLIVIMAETSAGKSQIAYGLMHKYLEARVANDEKKEQFLHAVTLEDPIEVQAYKREVGYPGMAQAKCAYRVEYSARHKKLDTDLRTGLSDCLRQKPAIVCVGEIRDLSDWEPVLEFAGTGHLVIATAHAGRLSEAMGKILNACSANTPAKRGDIGRKILAMVHLEAIDIEERKLTLMTVWHRENGGANSLVSEGLDSIVPHSQDNRGVLGAQAMCEKLSNKSPEARQALENIRVKKNKKNLGAELKLHALAHDARGL